MSKILKTILILLILIGFLFKLKILNTHSIQSHFFAFSSFLSAIFFDICHRILSTFRVTLKKILACIKFRI